MSIYEVPQPRLNSPFERPKAHWNILERKPERLAGRRRALYYYRDEELPPKRYARQPGRIGIGMTTVNLIRQRLAQWRRADYVGVTSTTRELLEWWRIHRKNRLFLAQLVQQAPSISPLFPYQLPWSLYDEELIKRDLPNWPEVVVPGKSNLWPWLLPFLAYYDYRPDGPKAESILKYAYISLTMLGKLWEKERKAWAQAAAEGQEKADAPILLIVCQNRVHAQVVYKWLAEDKPPFGVPRSKLRSLLNDNEQLNTLWADPTRHGSDSDASRWLRFTYQTIGQKEWPTNACPEARGNSGAPIYPTGFDALANKLGKRLHPPGRDVGCVIVAGSLPEGWHLRVTHLIGLRSFTSQLQCERVVGPALRRNRDHYDDADDEDHRGHPLDVLKVVGIPFEVVPFNAPS